jgi:hypothetical protein
MTTCLVGKRFQRLALTVHMEGLSVKQICRI